MTKRHLILLLIVILALVCIALLFALLSPSSAGTTRMITVGGKELTVELAQTPAAREQGLSGRDQLAEGHGMLFIFPEEAFQNFWMKEMQFPIDIIWVRGRQIAGILDNVPPPAGGPTGGPLSVYTSPVPVDMVLEIPAGMARRWSMTVGDQLLGINGLVQ